MIRAYKGTWPTLGERVFVDASAQVVGDVVLGDHSSVWMNAVVRGDVNFIRIGAHSSIQDNCVVHVQTGTHPTVVGEYVTVGHSVTLHGCEVGSHCLIGIGATVLNGARIGEYSIVAAGALVTEGTEVPSGSMVMGAPARVRRALTEGERQAIDVSAAHYHEYKETYLAEAAGGGQGR
jgi:carbonic anhydrase/acetyltransferase-like protein (isoleucine patch superfamily)